MPPLITARVLSVTTVVACLTVLITAAVHSASLGPNPAWLFDCNDTTCEDLWRTARLRYRAIGFWALALGALGWLAIGATLRAETHQASRVADASPGSGGAYAAAVALGPIATVAMLVASLGTLVGVLAVAAGCAVVAAVLIWRSLRRSTGREQYSWFAATLVVVVVFLFSGVVAALLWPVLYFVAPLPAATVGSVAGAVTVFLLISGSDAVATGRESRVEHTSGEARRSLWCVVLAAGLIAIGVASVYAVRPVPAPPADAVPATVDSAPEAVPDATAEFPLPIPVTGSQKQTAPPLSPVGLPACGSSDVALSLTSWDAAGGDSAATLVALNVGRRTCALRGNPALQITQGGRDLRIRHRPLDLYRLPTTHTVDGLGLAPGDRAESTVFWRGYRDAADHTAQQRVEVALSDGDASIPARIELDDGRATGPAPFDVVEFAEVQTGPWNPAR